MSRHASFLLGQALEALAGVAAAASLDAARLAASNALAGIVPAERDWPGVERGARSPLIGDVAVTPRALTSVPDVIACGHLRGRLVCSRDAHPAAPNYHVYVHPSWVPDRHQGVS